MGEFWIMSVGERGERYLVPASAEDVADQLRAMGWTVQAPTGTMTVPQAREHLGLPPRTGLSLRLSELENISAEVKAMEKLGSTIGDGG